MMKELGREEIRKGPWKVEEDEVLINHVNKYGPRDWSSIRSKGLLQRTGKSCRLRWVNKLRPNLKNGCKFSLEEERVVIELQAQFGNKWARIATYLPGRTDNDVKNFWSSRQKRLARILPQSKSSQQIKHCVPVFHQVPTLEAPKLSCSMEEESSSSRPQSCSSSHIDDTGMIKMVSLPDLINSNLPNYETNLCQFDFTPTEYQSQIPFPHIPQPQQQVPLSPESQQLVAKLGDPNFMDVFGHEDASGIGLGLTFFEQDGSCPEQSDKPDIFDSFPLDVFDQPPLDAFDQPPLDLFDQPDASPSEW
uniref:MYB transcription factor n=1 Tax=Paeonia suffruticosa TaxID=45171 RepID=A0A7M4C3E3_PAESU|nr:MYB transcription factor [Paeonia suffruticosa]